MGWRCDCGRMNPEHASACIHCAKPRMGAPSIVVIPKGNQTVVSPNVHMSNQALPKQIYVPEPEPERETVVVPLAVPLAGSKGGRRRSRKSKSRKSRKSKSRR